MLRVSTEVIESRILSSIYIVLTLDVSKAIEEVSGYLEVTPKEKQCEAKERFCSGNDVFVSLLTGYGKSLMLPLVFDKIRG